MNQYKVTIKFVAQNGHAWEEEYSSLEEADHSIRQVVETHGDIEKAYLLDENGNIDQTVWRFE